MKLLSLSTAEQGCSLAIVDNNSLVCEEFWVNKRTHSRRVLKMIDHMLEKRVSMKLDEIGGFVAAKGPGSFTGLRIGISVVKGIAQALDKPVAGISSLDGIAFRFQYCSIPVCVMMDARRDEVYCAVYEFDQGRLAAKSKEMVVNPEEAVSLIKGSALFVGSGSKIYQKVIEQTALNPIFSYSYQDYVSAVAIVHSLYLKENFFDNPETVLNPSYIRKSDAQLKWEGSKVAI